MGFEVKILADSVSPEKYRLTTMEVTFPRIVLAEFNTHRNFCLAGDSVLEFDLPAGTINSKNRLYSMRLDKFVDKWNNGAKRFSAKPKKKLNVSNIILNKVYTPAEIARELGITKNNINTLCRNNTIKAIKSQIDDRTWLITGEEIIRWRSSVPEHTRFDISDRLKNMRIRQLNEDTGDIQNSYVKNVFCSGQKEVFEIRTEDGFCIAGSKDHRILTDNGWKTISDISTNDFIVIRKFGKKESDKTDPKRLKKFDGKWRSSWQKEKREELYKIESMCRVCKTNVATDIHHIIPVYKDPSKAFDDENITFLCEDCHKNEHKIQGWQSSKYLYGALSKVKEIVSRGVEETYDLEIEGKYPNFLANGIVVHNSRNSASSRAIPIEKMIATITSEPYVPYHWGKNQKGMQAYELLDDATIIECKKEWLNALDNAVETCKRLSKLGVHKQITNRLMEPFMWQTVIVSSSEWNNFFKLRDHEAAHPDISRIAKMMRKEYKASTPKEIGYDEWHLPLIDENDKDLTIEQKVKVSVGRVCRVSYVNHHGIRDYNDDIKLHDMLVQNCHFSPTEHIAKPIAKELLEKYPNEDFCGNFRGWVQYRKTIQGESGSDFVI